MANDRAAARSLKLHREGFEVGACNRGPEKVRKFLGVGDRFDLLTQALWNALEADFQRFEDSLLLGEDQAFLATFLTALLTTFADTLLAELFGE